MCDHESTSSLATMSMPATLKELSTVPSTHENPDRNLRCGKIDIVSPEFPEFLNEAPVRHILCRSI